MDNYINYLPLYGRGALINIVEAPRNVGKTFTAKFWGTKRFLKTGKKFIWVRRTEDETKTAKGKFFKKSLLRKLGLTADDVRIKGNYGYIKRGRKWVDFVEFCSLSTAEKQRSNDDDDYTLMFVDETFVTPAKQAMYKGDEVRDFIDLYISKKRDHQLTAFLLGNKEVINNPYYQYFNITPPAHGFDGVRMFQGGELAVWTMSDYVATPDHERVDKLFKGTAYHDYMFNGAAKCASVVNYADTPKTAKYYSSFDFGIPLTVSRERGDYYVRLGVDKSRVVFVSRETMPKYPRSMLCLRRDKSRFAALETAYRKSRIAFDSPLAAEAMLSIFEKIGIAK